MPSQSFWRLPHCVIIKLLCTKPRHLQSTSLTRDTASGHPGKRVEGATPAVQSVQSSCLGRIGLAGLLPCAEARPVKPGQVYGRPHDRRNHSQTGSEILVVLGTSATQVATTNTNEGSVAKSRGGLASTGDISAIDQYHVQRATEPREAHTNGTVDRYS